MMRVGDPADLSRLREIQAATLAEPWPELLAAAVEGIPPVYVIEEGAVVGYAIVVAGESVAYVPEFATHPAHQGEGHGSRLMAGLRERLAAEGYDQLRLTVRVDDDAARSFYADAGFEAIDRLDDHFENCDGLLLALPLGGGETD